MESFPKFPAWVESKLSLYNRHPTEPSFLLGMKAYALIASDLLEGNKTPNTALDILANVIYCI
jgi:hypothetical protein